VARSSTGIKATRCRAPKQPKAITRNTKFVLRVGYCECVNHRVDVVVVEMIFAIIYVCNEHPKAITQYTKRVA